MTIAASLLPEFDHEMGQTRKLFQRIPDAAAGWKPHRKSYSMGDLVTHLANLPTWAEVTLRRSEFDLDPPDGSAPPRPAFTTMATAIATLDTNVAHAHQIIAETSDADFMASWTLRNRGQDVFSLPRIAVYRSFIMNHIIHHRGQLTVYLRQNDIPLPPLYGPTADERM